MPRYYPVYLDVSGRRCVVIGGGTVAERKAAGLLDAGAHVCVVSPQVTTVLQSLADDGTIEICAAPYRSEFLSGAVLAFAATGVRDVNAQVAADCIAMGLPVNVVDAPEEGSFIVPSVVRRGELCLSISTGGANPMLAARIADEMESRFGPEYGPFMELLREVRDTIKQWTDDQAKRRRAIGAVLDHEMDVREQLTAGQDAEALALALAVARAELSAAAEE